MRILGLDVGDKTIGVAVSDLLGLTAQGICTLKRTNIKEDIMNLKDIIVKYDVNKIVLGMPKNMNNTIGPRAKLVMKFAEELKKAIDIPCVFYDERLSTVQAEKILIVSDMSRKKRKKVIDKMAAVLILQGYLDQKKDLT